MAKLISSSEAARLSGYSQGYIIQMIKSKEIKGELVGNQYVADRDSFDTWLAKKGGPKKGRE